MQYELHKFFDILSEPLKKQINSQIYLPLLKKINLLENANSSELVFFLTRMKPCLFLVDEYVVKEGTRAENIFFISKGVVEVFIRVNPIPTRKQLWEQEAMSSEEQKRIRENDFKSIRVLYEGDYFGEVGMVTNLRRTASIKTIN